MTGDKFVVNLQTRECSCRKWMLTALPCVHAITSMQKKGVKVEDYVPDCFKKETYQNCYKHIIYPVNGQSVWAVTRYNDLQPPPIRRQPGRPKKKRNREAGELLKENGGLNKKGLKQKCRRCNQPGHNKATCKLHILCLDMFNAHIFWYLFCNAYCNASFVFGHV
jgi:hypothetical protein